MKGTACLLLFYFLASVFSVGYAQKVSGNDDAIAIEIHDNQNGCCSSQEYYIEDGRLIVDYYSEHGAMYTEGYVPDTILKKKLTKAESTKLKQFMLKFPFRSIDTLFASTKENPDAEAREISLSISFGKAHKAIQISDCYQKNVAALFALVNSFIPLDKKEQAKIKYLKSMFSCVR